jgi:hypothetical protein
MTVKHRLFQDVMLSGCGLYSVHMLTAPLTSVHRTPAHCHSVTGLTLQGLLVVEISTEPELVPQTSLCQPIMINTGSAGGAGLQSTPSCGCDATP